MLSEKFIDDLIMKDGGYVYCILSNSTSPIDESDAINNISKNGLHVVKMRVLGAKSVNVEFRHYMKHPESYEDITEEVWDSNGVKTIIKYKRRRESGEETYNKRFNHRMCKIIYGVGRSKDGNNDKVVILSLSYLPHELTNNRTINSDMKYYRFEEPVHIGDEIYEYETSKYFILLIDEYPSLEYPIVGIDMKSQFFETLEDACEYLKEMEA